MCKFSFSLLFCDYEAVGDAQDITIFVETGWKIYADETLDFSVYNENREKEAFWLTCLLGKSVTNIEILADNELEDAILRLTFSNQWRMDIIDNPQFESCNITFGTSNPANTIYI